MGQILSGEMKAFCGLMDVDGGSALMRSQPLNCLIIDKGEVDAYVCFITIIKFY